MLQRLGLAKPSTQTAARNLIGKAQLERRPGRFEIVDPLFARWVGELGWEQ